MGQRAVAEPFLIPVSSTQTCDEHAHKEDTCLLAQKGSVGQ